MSRRLLAVSALAMATLWLPPATVSASDQAAAGGVMRVSARVVAVEPLETAAAGGTCAAQAPPADGALVSRLAWDLRAHCPASRTVTGYRVTYQWDGRTYQRIMTHPPAGDTLGLRVSVR